MQPKFQTPVQHDSHAFEGTEADELPTRGATKEILAAVTHDAHDIVAMLGLYCDLLEAPGVLAATYLHYGDQLRLVASASRRLVQRLANLQRGGVAADQNMTSSPAPGPALVDADAHARWITDKHRKILPAAPIRNMAAQLLASKDLLATLAGPSVRITMDVQDAELPVRMIGEDLTRVLINLVKNSIEAMPRGGHIHLSLRESRNRLSACRWLMLTVEDNGTGIPFVALGKIFRAGYTTRSTQPQAPGSPVTQRGLGLFITRSIVRAAGGRIHAANRDPSGACFQIELPVGNG